MFRRVVPGAVTFLDQGGDVIAETDADGFASFKSAVGEVYRVVPVR